MTSRHLTPGRMIHGFTVTETTDLPELNLRQVRLVHERTGARYLHLEADDDNCLFAACFRTPPDDSTGVAHILEHTVLCGSERYPVRDPFFAMIKRSLNTFMNAMTASDWTSYPFASQNRNDFDNLLGIYLDAVFFPLLREEDFQQEGHRLEFDDEGRLTVQGVVFNEMKGAMASPSSLLSRRLARALYPTTTYHHNSGGEPEKIPDLTWQQLRDFHARYYHPSNSWLFSYGNRPLEQILEQVDRLALSRFDRLDIDSAVPSEQRIDRPRQVEERFPLDPSESPGGRSMVQVGWLTCDIEQSDERMLLHLLSMLLLGNPAAPLYRALLESGLGTNLAPGCGYHDDNRSTSFAAGLQGTDPDKAEAIEQLVLRTLDRVAAEGFDTERVEAALHRLEFANREVTGDSYPYPLLLLMRLLGSWLHADDPVTPLKLEEPLARLRQKLEDPAYLGREINRLLIDNPHRVRLLLRPDPKLQEEMDLKLRDRLDGIARQLSPGQAEEIRRRAEQLRKRQEQQDDLSCLPCLTRGDIRVDEIVIPTREIGVNAGRFHFFPQPSNGIAYLIGRIDCASLPASE
ncbi:MAG: peptidase M16, partial [Deltaproteobacteria bacterium]